MYGRGRAPSRTPELLARCSDVMKGITTTFAKEHGLVAGSAGMFLTSYICCTGRRTILCIGGLDVIRKEVWPFYRTSSGVRLCWELEKN